MIVIRSRRLRRALGLLIPFLLIPLLVAFGAIFAGEKRHPAISLGVALLSAALFLTGFEKRIIGSRRLVIVSVMTALCIVGRFIPFFKPITALTIITALYLGGEAGFLVGALAAVLSNFYFGQGPWTPFQMLAWGMLGLTAGYLRQVLKKSRGLLLLFGVLAGVLYSLFMDVWTVLWYDGSFRWALYLSAVASALPHTLLYSASNFFFLLLFARPFGQKMERIQIKYGI